MGLKAGGVRGSLRNVSTGVAAIPDSVIENFELGSGDPAGVYASGETLGDYYDGFDGTTLGSVSAAHTIQTGTVYDGSRALQMDSGDSTTGIVSHKGDGLNRYPEQGETWEFRAYFDGTAGDQRPVFMHYAVPDGDTPRQNSYRAEVKNGGSSPFIRIGKFSGGSFSELATSSTEPNNGEWLRAEIEWDNSDGHRLRVENADGSLVGEPTATDSDSNISGTVGIGWGDNISDTSDNVFVDAAKVI